MTGLELAPLVEIAVSIVTSIAAKFVGSFTFRWRVFRATSKALDFDFPRPRYRAWLNTIQVEDLTQPIEIGAPSLAKSLDRALSVNASWREDPERHSKAILIIETTYVSMIRRSSQAEADVLRDEWARARHEQLLERFVSGLGGPPRLGRGDSSSFLRRTSLSRRQIRLASFGVSAEAVEEMFEVLRGLLPAVSAGETRILVGPFGSGKSELAEAWFLNAVERYSSGETDRRPVWLHASELTNQSLSGALERHVDHAQVAIGVSVVIDGLDEVGGQVATRVADEARAFVVVNKNSSCLLTCRPGVLATMDDHIPADGLKQDDATRLVELIAGSPRATWAWDPLLVDAIRRPFFAIAAGLQIAENEKPTGQAALIRRLVERALDRQTAASVAVTSDEIYQLLIKLGVSLTTSSNQADGLIFQQRQKVRTSTLVTQRVDGRIEFSLPIFQQWFTAQAVLLDQSLIDVAVGSPETFDRWRWALAIAGLAASPALLDVILRTSFLADPGAGSWILSRVADGHRWFRSEESAIDVPSAPGRLLIAMRTIIDSIGPLAPLVYRMVAEHHSFTLGVRVDANRVSTGWKTDPVNDLDQVVSLPEEVHPLAGRSGDWVPDRSGSVAEGDEWPWILSKDRLQGSVLDLLNKHPRLGPLGGVWHIESRYRAARIAADNHSMFFEPMASDSFLPSVKAILARTADPLRTQFQFGHRSLSGVELLDLVTWIEADGVANIRRPVPVPDFPEDRARSGWIWDLYSHERITEFYAEVYGNACVAYDEARATVFSSFAWSMGRAAHGQFAVIADLSYTDSGWGGSRSPGLSGALIPVGMLDDAVLNSGATPYYSANGRAAVTVGLARSTTESWVEEFVRRAHTSNKKVDPSINPFAHGRSSWRSIADHVNHSRPASLMAANWIFDDLKSLDLASGTFPQLDR